MRLILIRHGQTPSNVRNLLDTAVPGPGLTDLGRRQALAIPAALAWLNGTDPLAALYVSNQTRAQLTAAPLAAALGLEPRIRSGLREISAGGLEMQGDLQSIGAYLEVVRDWIQGKPEIRMPGADTGNDVLARFDAVVREAELASGGGTVAMVSHGAMIRTWSACRAGNLDPEHRENYALSNTGIVVLEGSTTALPGKAGSGTSASRAAGGTGGGAANGRGRDRTWEVVSWQSQPAGGLALADTTADGPTDDSDADGFAHGPSATTASGPAAGPAAGSAAGPAVGVRLEQPGLRRNASD
ncbi:histidine phosphatase family protein [Arthrobacter sp. A5]|uniref:histidine phosphatase family protein n=1 Tax=Arthrobacter sp. A5 TaxID=576926 RepID=UPI003DA84428